MLKKPSLTIEIKVKTRSELSKLIMLDDNKYLAHLHAIADKNRANIELLQLVSDYFKVNKAQVKIIKGQTNRNKTIAIYE